MMIGGPIPPPGDPWGDGGPAAWRERERRQRSVRLLMMFLLMLLLMDGEEHQARQRREPGYHLRKKKGATKPLERSVYRARVAQDERVHKIVSSHPRYKRLVKKNGANVEVQVRKWAEQQQELEQDGFDAKAPVKEDPENDKPVFHYPWNTTGFYRGEWVRETKTPAQTSDEDGPDENSPSEETETENEEEAEKAKYVSAVDLEGPVEEMLKERKERVGVFLLPDSLNVDLGSNFTESRTETAAAQAAAQSLRAQSRRTPGSPFLRISNPELNVVVEEAADEETDAAPHITLTKESGRAAFQFYSRPVQAMKELSLVDGFIKLYDSNTVGYSTRRDILLRVRGVLIHSIGRLSLVSNAAPGRSAFVISDAVEKEDSKHRRLKESLMALGDHDVDDEQVERIRDDALALYPLDTLNDALTMEEGGWKLTSLDFDESASTIPRRRLNVDVDVEDDVESSTEIEEDSEDGSVESEEEESGEDEAEEEELESVQTRPVAVALTKREGSSTTDRERALIDEAELDGAKEMSKSSPKLSKIVVPFPFVADDKEGSIRKAKTPLSRRMPPREQLLEVNAGRCEFEINLDVTEIEWKLGQWRQLMTRMIGDTNRLDPSMLKKEAIDTEDDEEHVSSKKRSRTASPTKSSLAWTPPPKDHALVMAMLGNIKSPNCEFSASLNATAIRTDWEHTTGKAVNYSFYMMLTCLVQIVVLLRQLLHTQSQSAATRVSLLSVGWQTVVDALVCLAHIYLSLAMQPLFTAFASVAFFKLLIFCVIEMKYMAIIIQARNSTNGGQNTTELLRRQVAMLHLRFYVALVGAFLAFFYAGNEYRTVYMLVLYSFWVPQIVQNVITEAKRPLHSYYIYGMSVTRMVAPLYIFAVPNNFLKEVYPDAPTNPFMCELLVLWVAIQTAVLIAQGKYGARFMIPARFLPPKFDYSRPIPSSMLPPDALELSSSDSSFDNERTSEVQTLIPSDSQPPPERHVTSVTRNRIKGNRAVSRTESSMTTEAVQPESAATLDCVICYNGIDVHNRKGYMLAPCNHLFHRECLMQWMDVKMECPICRTELPSL